MLRRPASSFAVAQGPDGAAGARGSVLTRTVAASRDPAVVYNNMVVSRDELPAARAPPYFRLAKVSLLVLCSLCFAAGLASVVFGVYCEVNRGLFFPGARDVPYGISTAAIFFGSFAASVSLALLAIVCRNWYPSLLTFGLFVLWIAAASVALAGMMTPGPSIRYERSLAWARMPPSSHVYFYRRFNCCGYENASTCDLTAIGLRRPVAIPSTTAPAGNALVAVPPASVSDLSAPAVAESVFSMPSQTVPKHAAHLQRRQAPAQAGPGSPLPVEPSPTFSPVPVPTSGIDGGAGADVVRPCKLDVAPLFDKTLENFRKFYIVDAAVSMLQLGALTAFWALLGRWKRLRGVGRW